MTNAVIRAETPADRDAVWQVVRRAFGQDDEANLVHALHDGGWVRAAFVAETAGRIVGHVLFSDLPIEGAAGTVASLALAPLGVLPEYQRQGIGTTLVRHALEACRDQGHRIVVVLGDPAYYGRFGFSSKLGAQLDSPFPRDAFQALELVPGALAGVAGCVRYAPPFGI